MSSNSKPDAGFYRTVLREMFDAAIAAAQPALVLPQHLPSKPKGRTIVLGGGKASAAMARALEENWPHELSGCVVTRDGHEVACNRIEVLSASHPVPDERSVTAGKRMLELVSGLTEDDLVIALVSGGGSSLLSVPAEGLTLDDKQAVTRALLRSGAAISEMNIVRKQLSAIKGGKLAEAAYPARVVTLLISDVPGDDPSAIASGPTIPDASTPAKALEILERYGITEPASVIRHLKGAEESSGRAPSNADNAHTIIARPQASLEAAARIAEEHGITPVILGDALEGESRDLARELAEIARRTKATGETAAPPCALISGGETTVTVRGNGRGGRNVEFLLALAVELNGLDETYAIAGDTDGVDGAEEVAGAVIAPDTLTRAQEIGIDPRAFLENNDGHTFFERLGDQVVTGPTLTNVNDFRCIIVGGSGQSL